MNIQKHSKPQHQMARLAPMEVRETRTFKNGYTYAVCPRCSLSMEREYVHYCNNCGQKLSWKIFDVQSASMAE